MDKDIKTRKLKGIVISDKMDKTIVVKVNRIKKHPKYFRQYQASKKYSVHDPRNLFKQGDAVEFVAIRPISKNKRWAAVYSQTENK